MVLIGPIGRQWSLPKSTAWCETICSSFDEEQFKSFFRVSKRLYQEIVNQLFSDLEGQVTRFRNPIPVAKKILIGLFRLGSTSELRVAAQLFGVGISTVAGIQHQFTAAIIKHFGNKVHWPSTDEELLKISEDFARIWDYPLCIGSVDGCHIPCSPKAADATDFYNYKGWYSTILFAVADASYKFIYFNVGCPGRMNDGFIFRRSALKEKLEAQAEQFLRLGRSYDGIQIPLHLIGDSAFPLVHNLMKPYPQLAQLNDDQRNFNFRLSRARRVIENAFGRLKARFRILLKRMEISIQNVNDCIVACAILHNMCEESRDSLPIEWLIETEGVQNPLLVPNTVASRVDRATTRSAVQIRNKLAENLNQFQLVVEN